MGVHACHYCDGVRQPDHAGNCPGCSAPLGPPPPPAPDPNVITVRGGNPRVAIMTFRRSQIISVNEARAAMGFAAMGFAALKFGDR